MISIWNARRNMGCFPLMVILCVGLLCMPSSTLAQASSETAPPVEQPLVREGDFAVDLAFGLALGTTDDEVEAENILSEAGIAPKNGWIADYPVTPDILSEIRDSIENAAGSKALPMSAEEALRRFDEVASASGLSVKVDNGELEDTAPMQSKDYPDPVVVNNYYYNQGPPIVTYYTPPPSYYYLYEWVPYSFWWSNYWFPGFFVLRDFHKVVVIHKRPHFISNHFNDFRRHRVFRIDPGDRFHGRTFAGIGAHKRKGYLSTGDRRSSRTIFNREAPGRRHERRSVTRPDSRSVTPRPPGRTFQAPQRRIAPARIAPSPRTPSPGRSAPATPRGGMAPPGRGGAGFGGQR